MAIDSVNVAEHPMKLRQSTLLFGRCEDTAGVGNRDCFDQVKMPCHEQPMRHRTNSASVFAPNIRLAIDDKPGYVLARSAVLHPGFLRIDGKSGQGDNF